MSMTPTDPAAADVRSDPTSAFYRAMLEALIAADVPFLVGGAYAFVRYTGIARNTKDLDIFLRERDVERAMAALSDVGCATELTFPHWLGKAACGEDFIDLIFSSGNGVATVDDEWFAHAVEEEVLGLPVRLTPPEEMLWSKAYVMERERFDGADVNHLLRAAGATMDWPRLLRRFDDHWRVLLTHLTLFGFVYPSHAGNVPAWVMHELIARLEEEIDAPPDDGPVCRGTLISREQYLPDLEQGYRDARLQRLGGAMTTSEIADWTAAIDETKQ
jgi:hypothetical protein